MDFVTGVNRLMRINRIIKGDDDAITTFADTQHAADIQLAQIAIQSELTEIVSSRLISYEKTNSTITLLTSTRSYALASNFVRFYGKLPSFYDSTTNTRIYMLKGGEDSLMNMDYKYKTNEGTPVNWYWEDATTKQVSFYLVPDSNYNNRSLSYEYEKDVSVTVVSDTLPFHSTIEANAFIDCAARRFMYMKNPSLDIRTLLQDPIYKEAKASLYNLMRPVNPSNKYGSTYG